MIAVVHAGAVRGEEVDGTDRPVAAIDAHQRGLRIDAVGEERLVVRRVAIERRRRTIDARVTQFALGQRHLGGAKSWWA